jgi:hypothetical protein
MTRPIQSRSRLLVSCAGSAMALALAMVQPERAAAQAIQATPTAVPSTGSVLRIPVTTGEEIIQVSAPTANPTVVIDWTPDLDGGGNALDFLPTGTTVTFRNDPLGNAGQNFAVLNRILPAPGNNVVVLDGTVNSRIASGSAAVITSPGGFVAFYSPTGIFVGSNARFDVGSLLLTTLDTTPASFRTFSLGTGSLELVGATGSTAGIVVDSSAQINAGTQIDAPAGSYFTAMVGASVQMGGSALVNGGHAYVAGEQVNLSFTNGLFDIQVPVGTAASGDVLQLLGTIGGPSSTGTGDHHMIYGVMRSATVDPIRMLVTGPLGFDDPLSAGIVNGEIILSANYDVQQRSVNGGSLDDGIDVEFDENSATSSNVADILLRDFSANSTLLAIGTNRVEAYGQTAAVFVDGDLLLAGRAALLGDSPIGTQNITVTGDMLAYANAFGVVGTALSDPSVINALGGSAAVASRSATSTVSITGDLRVTASALAGSDGNVAGTATGGTAELIAIGGTVSVGGTARVSAEGRGTVTPDIVTGAPINAGAAIVSSTGAGSITVQGGLTVSAAGTGAAGSLVSPSSASDVFGGIARVSAGTGGRVTVNGNTFIAASVTALGANTSGPGPVANAGLATMSANSATSSVTIGNGGSLTIQALGLGGANAGGTGGDGFGGQALASVTNGGTITVSGDFTADAFGRGGNGLSGGDGFGGLAGADAFVGSIDLQGAVFAGASGTGGNASLGFGGTGGDGIGGAAVLQARGTLAAPAELTLATSPAIVTLFARGQGGTGGASDGSTIGGGRGGDGIGGQQGTANQANSAYENGAYLRAGGDNGTLTVNAAPGFTSEGFGGAGGAGAGALAGGNGGDGLGGHSEAGLALLGTNGSLGQGTATFTSLSIESQGRGGSGGLNNGQPSGNGGSGTGGTSLLLVEAGLVTATDVSISAVGTGLGGAIGGTGTGGVARLDGNVVGATANFATLRLNAPGTGGAGNTGIGGSGQGGTAIVSLGGTSVTVSGLTRLTVDGTAGITGSGDGADGTGGTALIDIFNSGGAGSLAVSGNTQVIAGGFGGAATPGATGGTGTGGSSTLQARGGGTLDLQLTEVSAGGLGGTGTSAAGGDGIGGSAAIRTSGAGSSVRITGALPFGIGSDNEFAFVGASGLGGIATGGSGIGGAGRGGQVDIVAAGGSIILPGTTPDRLLIAARGTGGRSSVDGGAGGIGVGGIGTFEADNGGAITIGTVELSIRGLGGSSTQAGNASATINVDGGDAVGGERRIIARGGSTITGEFFGGLVGGEAGSGSGTGVGGDGTGGTGTYIFENATFNAVGSNFLLGGGGTGGNGLAGGNATGGAIDFVANNATINMSPGEFSPQIVLFADNTGGTGITQGGNANGSVINISVTSTTINGGTLLVTNSAVAGSADTASGAGGDAVSGNITADFTGSVLDLVTNSDPLATDPYNAIRTTATGGAGATGGSAVAGNVSLSISGGSLDVATGPNAPGNLEFSSTALGGDGAGGAGGAATAGGLTIALAGANIQVQDSINLESSATGGASTGGTGGAASGGSAILSQDGAASTIGGDIAAFSTAQGGTGAVGGNADSGVAIVEGLSGTLQLGSILSLNAAASGGGGSAGAGGEGAGGRASVVVNGGALIVEGAFSAFAAGRGGDGTVGGDGLGGIAGANARVGTIELRDSASVDTSGTGGAANVGFGGNGGIGRGGNSFLQADGTLTQTATVSVALGANLLSNGFGGDGGVSDGVSIAAGRGGDGLGGDFGTPNQADPAFNSGAFLLAGGDNGRISLGGDALVQATGFGGEGGAAAGTLNGGEGGDGVGGLAQAGLALLGLDGSVGAGTATFAGVQLAARGVGGAGGAAVSGPTRGIGGDGQGGQAAFTVRAGTASAGDILAVVSGTGGDGNLGGTGTGGLAYLLGGFGGGANVVTLSLLAGGIGGQSFSGVGGAGLGGGAFIDLDGADLTITGGLELSAGASGGNSILDAGGAATGGDAFIAVDGGVAPSTVTVTGNALIETTAAGGVGRNGGTGGDGEGGTSYIQVQGGGVVRIGTLQVSATGFGSRGTGEGGPFIGGDGTGGLAELRVTGTDSALIVERNTTIDIANSSNAGGAILSAVGVGGNTTGAPGIGGSGTGGSIGILAEAGGSITLPLDPVNDPDSVGPIRLVADGIGGASSVAGGSGGTGTGGIARIRADNAVVDMGRTLFSASGEGGEGVALPNLPGLTVNGGNAQGGSRTVSVLARGTLTAELAEGTSGSFGGDGIGNGNGGSARGGLSSVNVDAAALNIVGDWLVESASQGGAGTVGGSVISPGTSGVQFRANASTVAFIPDAMGRAQLRLGAAALGGSGLAQGGDAIGSPVTVTITNSVVTDGLFAINSGATGGAADTATGIGGGAAAGAVIFTTNPSTIGLFGRNRIVADAVGGIAATGGDATAGDILVNLSATAVTIDGGPGNSALELSTAAVGGRGTNVVGNAAAGTATLRLVGASITAAEVGVTSQALANSLTGPATGGAAQAGTAQIVLSGASLLDADTLLLDSFGLSSTGGSAAGGLARLATLAGGAPEVSANELLVRASGLGSSTERAGRFAIELASGTLDVQVADLEARGSTAVGTPSTVLADGGRLQVADGLTVNVSENLAIATANGGAIGGTTASAFVTSQGTIAITGDNDAVTGLVGNLLVLEAREVDIAAGARIGGQSAVELVSLDTANTAVIGGTAEQAGFTLTAAEVARIAGPELTFIAPAVTGNAPNEPHVLIRDFTVAGSLAGGKSAVRILGDNAGIVRVEGTVTYADAAADDLFSIFAGERIEIVTPGGIRVLDAAGRPGGRLSLNASDIWAADAATIAQLQADVGFAGRDALLAVAAAGANDPLGYLRARSAELAVGESLLIRNTGTALEPGGITVGAGGLTIRGNEGSPVTIVPLDVAAYGRRQRDDGTFVTGAAFFGEVDFSRTGTSPTTYESDAALNDCLIVSGTCPVPPPPPPPPPRPPVMEVINNPVTVISPSILEEVPATTVGEEDQKFGMDFPDFVGAPLISEDPLLDDPVASGGDAARYEESGQNQGQEP